MPNQLIGIIFRIFFIFCPLSFILGQDQENIYKALSISSKDLKTNTAVYSLEKGGESMLARLWLFENAKNSIDIQYYSFAKDVTGAITAYYVISAADRGVKIRLLIDDAAARMRSDEIQILNSHENIEVRVYNAGLRLGRLDRRLKKTLKNHNRLLRRMHNKTIIVDKQASILGGRNIADEYFDYDHKYNFRDRCLLMLGNATSDVENAFNEFWNDPLTVLYSELSGKSEKKWRNRPDRFERVKKQALKKNEFNDEFRTKVSKYAEELKNALVKNEMLLLSNVSFISDKPGKNEEKQKREGGICSDSIIQLIKSARHSLSIQSPYFILTKEFTEAITEVVKRGVKVTLLTNSLGSTDNFEAFSGYQKDRKEILKMGVEIHEFKPRSKVRYTLMVPDVQAKLNYKPVYGFHPKTMIIDSVLSVTGSFNFDPRSANYNTECVSVIRSKEFTKLLSKHLEEELKPENAWITNLECNPDSKAPLKNRCKAFVKRIIPKKLL
jgi:cardiolipin synthase C